MCALTRTPSMILHMSQLSSERNHGFVHARDGLLSRFRYSQIYWHEISFNDIKLLFSEFYHNIIGFYHNSHLLFAPL